MVQRENERGLRGNVALLGMSAAPGGLRNADCNHRLVATEQKRVYADCCSSIFRGNA